MIMEINVKEKRKLKEKDRQKKKWLDAIEDYWYYKVVTSLMVREKKKN